MTTEMMTTDWRPHDGPQTKFHQCGAFEVLYGGAAGGGKTDSLLMEAARQVDKAKYKAILFRRTFPELETSLIIRSFEWYPALGGKPKDSGKVWTFPSGAVIRFGHMEHDKDVHKHQSAQYDFIGFDELTSFTEFQYLYMFSRCRGTDPTIKRYVRAGTNPGNLGHVWVKKRFVEGKTRFKVYRYRIIGGAETMVGKEDPMAISRAFIPAKLTDNPTLVKNDPLYLERMKLLPAEEQRMLIDGDWDVFQGQFFQEWRYEKHVVEPFQIPDSWFKFRAIDYGRTAPFCCKWYAVDQDGHVWVYREYYEAGKLASENFQAVHDLSGDEQYKYTVADPSIFAKTHLPESIADVALRHGVACIPASNERIAGWNSVKEYLKWTDYVSPKISYFSTCVNSIRTIPQQIHDKMHAEDLDTKAEDHAVDVDRYFLQTLRMRKSAKPLDPLEERIKKLKQETQDISVGFYTNSVQ